LGNGQGCKLEVYPFWKVLIYPETKKRKEKLFKKYLMHEKLWVRFGTLLGVVMAAFLGAWILSYLLLPEGLLRGRSAAQVLAGNDLAGGSVWLEWLRLLAINIGVVFLSIIGPNLFRNEKDYPLGYTSTTLIAVIFGVTIGTDSFSMSIGGKMPPTFAVFNSSGLYEIIAYVLAAAATVSISRYRLIGKGVTSIIPPKTKSVVQERLLGVLLAIGILLIACGWESYRFSQAIASMK